MSDFDTPRDEQGRFLADHYRTEHERLEFTPLEERPRDEDSAPIYSSSTRSERRPECLQQLASATPTGLRTKQLHPFRTRQVSPFRMKRRRF